MPNYCSCRLIITGDLTVFNKTLNTVVISDGKAEKREFSFAQTAPEDPDEKDWYNWRIDNWGVKWDICEAKIISSTDEIFDATFNTAWSYPENWIKNCIKNYPELTIKIAFCEMGIGFFGMKKYDKTGLIDIKNYENMHDSGDYKYDEDTEQEILSGDLKDFIKEYEISLGG